MLFHNGVFLYIVGDDNGYSESLWVEVPEGSKHPSVPLIHRIEGKPGLMDLAGELAMGLPFYLGAPIIRVSDNISVCCTEELARAWNSSSKSYNKDRESMKKRFDALVKQLCKN